MLVPLVVSFLVSFVAPAGAAQASCLRPPVTAPIVEHFESPPCPYCAGNRGIRFATARGAPVRAAASGVVVFAGWVVDTYYVVVRHGDGLRATYGALADSPWRAGQAVAAGSLIGLAADRVYFGLRDEQDRYLDPEPLLGRLMVPPYLVPTDGTAARLPPQPVLRCSG